MQELCNISPSVAALLGVLDAAFKKLGDTEDKLATVTNKLVVETQEKKCLACMQIVVYRQRQYCYCAKTVDHLHQFNGEWKHA